MTRNFWTRDEMILVLNLYLKTPFGKMHKGNPDVVKTASLIGRTANAVAYRLVNYAACDPLLKARGIVGMSHGGKKCEEYWQEFANDRERLLFESEQILAKFEGISIEAKFEKDIKDIPDGLVGLSKERQTMVRVNQNVFRQIVLANYDGKCALTGMDIAGLLVASHIIPWAGNKKERLNPENGICLSCLYDKAFDQGLISFDDKNKIMFSKNLSDNAGKDYYDLYFRPIRDAKLAEAKKYPVNKSFLEWHRDCIFKG